MFGFIRRIIERERKRTEQEIALHCAAILNTEALQLRINATVMQRLNEFDQTVDERISDAVTNVLEGDLLTEKINEKIEEAFNGRSAEDFVDRMIDDAFEQRDRDMDDPVSRDEVEQIVREFAHSSEAERWIRYEIIRDNDLVSSRDVEKAIEQLDVLQIIHTALRNRDVAEAEQVMQRYAPKRMRLLSLDNIERPLGFHM